VSAVPPRAVLALACLALAACRAPREPEISRPSDPPASESPRPPSEGELALEQALVAYEGVLQGGMMAIGGEHTGWVLRGAEGQPDVEVDPGPWLERAIELQGRRVRARGLWQTLRYVERGNVRVLALRELAAAP